MKNKSKHGATKANKTENTLRTLQKVTRQGEINKSTNETYLDTKKTLILSLSLSLSL